MKLRHLAIGICGLALAALCLGTPAAPTASPEAPGVQVAHAAAKAKKPTAKQLKFFKTASDRFATDLFKRCVSARGKNANVAIAPMSVLNAMAMTANGAKGKTAKQMRKVLAGGKGIGRLNRNLRWFNGQLVDVKKAHVVNANSIWYDDSGSLKVKRSFVKTNRTYLDAETYPASFSDPQTLARINGWVSDKTEGTIREALDSLAPEDELVLVNAQYLDAKWKAPFEASATGKQAFTSASGKKRKVPMMHGRERRYIEGKGVTGFVKPYAKGYSFVALLPEKGTNAKQYVKTMRPKTLRKLVASAKETSVDVTLPKLDLSYTNDTMERQLGAMGMGLVFNPRKANLSKMGSSKKGRLHVGQVVHKTKVKVDEEGTKAAAVTAVLVKASSAVFERPKRVVLDRPFVYAVIDDHTKLPVFIGTVSSL